MTLGERDGASWLPVLRQARWFGGKGRAASVSDVAAVRWYTARGSWPALRSEVVTVTYADGDTEHYHLLVRSDGPDSPGHEATHDQAARTALVGAALGGGPVPPVSVWAGEQSNTMLCVGEERLLKLLRKIEPGPSLEAEMLAALDGACAPRLLGRITAEWPPGTTTDLGLLMERVPDARDGWDLASQACAREEDFTDEAGALGAALGRVHARLAEVFGTGVRDGAAIADTMLGRLRAAASGHAELARHAPALAARLATLRGRSVPVQRVHGDFHLGQALRGPSGWTIVDFEGEPATPFAERRRPDSVWRDVAGMLRSFDYVRSAHPNPDGPTATSWAEGARGSFLKGYCGPREASDAVLAAYETDKAVYEVVYELRNRPDWVGIPLGAIRRLVAAAPRPQPDEKETR